MAKVMVQFRIITPDSANVDESAFIPYIKCTDPHGCLVATPDCACLRWRTDGKRNHTWLSQSERMEFFSCWRTFRSEPARYLSRNFLSRAD